MRPDKDGWIITHDPLSLKIGATKILAAEKNSRKLAVVIKSFVSPSEVEDLKNALGQHILYYDILEEVDPDRILYIAVFTCLKYTLKYSLLPPAFCPLPQA